MTVRPIVRVADPTTVAWEHVDRFQREAFVERTRAVVGRVGS